MTPQPSEIVIPSGSCSDDSTSGDSGYQDDISSKGSDTSEPPELPERSDLPEVLERPDSPEMESPGQIESFEMTLETLDQEQQEKPLEPLKPLDISSTPSPILKALPPLITTHVPQSKPFLKIVEKTIVATAKVVVLGNSGVGKTSIIYSHRFNLSGVQHHTATIGASYVKVLVDVGDNRQVQLQVWDTAGQERFRCMVPMYTRNAAAAFVFYDICSRTSFQDVDKWVNGL
uniref:Ras-related protein Rab-19 n=1 Tax=Panagrellus redivivus TaxID=6233 RepID=A0A7E4UUK4_PANRE